MRRWLTRRSRVPAILRITLALVLAALAITGLAAPGRAQTGGPIAGQPNSPTKSPLPPGSGDPTTSFPSSPALVAEGRSLYSTGCSSCHGIALQGTPGIAPALRGVGPGAVDFYLSTGRMPLEQPREQPMRAKPLYDSRQISALVAYVSSFGGPPSPATNPAAGDLALGLHEFTLHCAGCHQVVARGGLTLGAVVPNLQQATPLEIAQAVRMGPYLMPHFDSKQINQHQLDSIVRYVLWTRSPVNAGGWGIYNIGPIPEGMVAWFIGLLAMVIVARLIGERMA